MADFFRAEGDDGLWFHSERGLLSHLFHQRPLWIMDAATNGLGQTLGSVLKSVQRTRFLTEFELGKRHGFGCPDGGVFVEAGERQTTKSFIFVEAKRRSFADEYREPLTQEAFSELAATNGIEAVRSRTDGFNSSINGQLELRWRFANALKENTDENRVTEGDVPPLLELRVNDRFYLGRHSNGLLDTPGRWRTVGMSGGLGCLYRELRQVDKFHLLAITADGEYPTDLRRIRLFDTKGLALDAIEKRTVIFWLSFDRLMAGLERWSSIDGMWTAT